MIAGLDTPTAGHIRFDGKPIEHLPPERRDISMVFQSIALYPHKTVYENIAFPLRMARRSRSEIDERVRQAADLLRIEPLLLRRPHQLSGGQRQRVALGRAVVRNPAVFLFDEPLSALDAKLRVDMRVEIKKLHERLGATFIYVTHDQIEALTMADRIAVIDNGRLQQYGSPDEVYQRPTNTMVAKFVGSPSMNLVPGMVSEEKGNWTFEARGLSLPLFGAISNLLHTGRDSEVVLGIRPEGVEVNAIGNHDSVSAWIYATGAAGLRPLSGYQLWRARSPWASAVQGTDQAGPPAAGRRPNLPRISDAKTLPIRPFWSPHPPVEWARIVVTLPQRNVSLRKQDLSDSQFGLNIVLGIIIFNVLLLLHRSFIPLGLAFMKLT